MRFREVLVGCDVWNAGKTFGDPAVSWWSESLRPDSSVEQLLGVGAWPDADEPVLALVDAWARAVEQVARARHRIMGSLADPGRAPGPGRLLLFAPLMSLHDGVAGDLTAGFFDVHNCPAWDTRVMFLDAIDRSAPEVTKRCHLWESCLVAFIPEGCVATVERGVSANAEECIAWADELVPEPRLRRMIDDAMGRRTSWG